jgi:two-component system OmpR family sensor kinase
MARLFVSLYLFIALSLVALSAGLEKIFFSATQVTNGQTLVTVLEAAKQQNVEMIDFVSQIDLPYQNLMLKDIAWPENDLKKLQQGHAIVVSNSESVEQIYILNQPQQLLEISLPKQNSNTFQFTLYSIIFFLLLGGVIALWLWPLWQDLSKLEQTVSKVLPDGSIAKNTIGQKSLVFPIAKSLNNMSEQISKLMQQQRELSSAVAHEFRTPLARLKFALAMGPSSQSEPYKDMQQDVNELERLVQEMLDYASTNTQAPEMSLAEIPIKQLSMQLIQRLKNSHLAHLETTVHGNDLTILADEHFIERAIENLLLNASRFAKQRIQILIKQNQDKVEISIEDDGSGVPKDLRNKIFTAFYRPDESRNRQQGGAGLGLAIVKRITDWHQGSCYVSDSKLGGAKFVVILPNPFATTL